MLSTRVLRWSIVVKHSRRISIRISSEIVDQSVAANATAVNVHIVNIMQSSCSIISYLSIAQNWIAGFSVHNVLRTSEKTTSKSKSVSLGMLSSVLMDFANFREFYGRNRKMDYKTRNHYKKQKRVCSFRP